MPRESVLVEIVTAANMTGIKEAQAGFLGMSNSLTAMIAALGIAVVAGKSAVDIAEKHEKAESDLAQAIKATGGNYEYAQGFLDHWIAANRAYISDQAEVIDGYATLTRAGLSQAEVQLDMNRALDLAALKHISLSDAIALVNQAEHGRLRGLVDLGITSKAYVDSSGNVVDATKNMALVMYELDQKTAHGRETMTQTSQATNKLSNDWQDIAKNVGPPLIQAIDLVAGGLDWVANELKKLGENKDFAKFISDAFGHWQDLVVGVRDTIRTIVGDIQWLIDNGGKVANFLGGGGKQPPRIGPRGFIPGASGFSGTVNQPTFFLAGEGGSSEHVQITPGGSGGSTVIHIHMDGIYAGDGASLDLLAQRIANRVRFAAGT